MLTINKKYVTDEQNRPFAVQVDIETFEKMENLLEDYALGQLMNENNSADYLILGETEEYYRTVSSSSWRRDEH